MKKDLDWVIQEIHATRKVLADSESSGNETADEFTFNNGKEAGLVDVLKLLDQLDEPEVLSQEWIDEHRESTFDLDLDEDFETVFIKVEDLQNLLVPKQELPVIPNYVAKWISVHHEQFDLYPALKRLENNALSWEDVYEWYRKNTRKFVSAYLTGEYEVEKEQKYYAKLKKPTPPKKEWMSNLSGGHYWMIDEKGLRLGEYLAEPVSFRNDASIYTLEDWERHGINDSNADFVK